jgi:hypothetical protein
MLHLLLVAELLVAPAPSAPPDDPLFTRCLKPGSGVHLQWTPGDEGVATYVLVKRRDDDGDWKTWVKSYAKKPPFTLNMHGSLARNGNFAWRLFGVDRGAGEFAMGEWRYFCTRE